jgi:DNA sulfur modification protein DndE
LKPTTKDTKMTINIKTSEASHILIKKYSNDLKLPAENIIARIALGYSISKNRILDLKNVKDSKGKEYKDETFFGKHKTYFVALICQLYTINRSDINIPKLIKMHVDEGLELMNKFFESNNNHTIYDFLIEAIDRGIESIEHSNNPFKFVENSNRVITDKQAFEKLWKIEVGKDEEGEKIIVEPNNKTKYNNCHMAIAGTTGSGKTQFALDLISQIVKQSEGKTNYIYLDFKGLNTEDVKQYKKFFDDTKTEFINAPNKKIPINPLSFIDNVNEDNKKLGINKFVDYIVEYSNAGSSQKQQLRDATRAVFNAKKNGKYPTLQELYNEIPNHFQKMPNVVTEIIQGLSDPAIFSDETNKDFLNKNYYFSLSADLHQSIRFTSIFLVINYIYNTFMSMTNTNDENGIRGMRYVLLIDEAQVIFRDKKAKFVLQQILEQIRSKGVAVILLAQNIDEFDQPNFNFSSLCEIGFLLKIADLTVPKKIQKFLGLSEKEANAMVRSLEQIQTGQGVSNIREFKKGELFNVSQFYKRNK